jgi:putative phosphoribosyl transferase
MFHDRCDAGCRLARKLAPLESRRTVVVGLPRGGVPVAFEVACALNAPLDVIIVRKLGLPAQPELAMGALGEDGVCVVNQEVLRAKRVGRAELTAVVRHEADELERRVRAIRGETSRIPLSGRTVVIVDDGIATGSTARAACEVALADGAKWVILAVPVASRSALDALAAVVDEVVCIESPRPFLAVGQSYGDFAQVSDEEVVALLRDSRPERFAH